MIRRFVSAVALTLALVAPLASHASIFGRTAEGSSVGTAKGKTVKIMLKNKTASPMTVYLDGRPVTLAANGGTQEIKTTVGTDIYGDDQTTVRLHVTPDLSGNTVSFR